VGFGCLVAVMGDVGRGSRCPVLLFVKLLVGLGESAFVRSVGRCGSFRLQEIVRLCPAELVFVLSDVAVEI